MRIVLASLDPMRGAIVDSSHQLALAFARRGHEVLHVSTPVTPVHLARLRYREVRQRFRTSLGGDDRHPAGIRELIPFSLVPGWVQARIGGPRNLMLGATLPPLRHRLDQLGFSRAELLVIDQPLLFDLWAYVECSRIVYRPIDVFPLLMGNPRVARLERRILEVADCVVSASEPVAAHVRGLSERAIPEVVLENGVEYERFAAAVPPPAEYSCIPTPRAVYVGSLDARFDWEGVAAAAETLPHVQFVLIGPTKRVPERARRIRNMHVLGPRRYECVPGYLQHASVGLLPFGDHPVNRGRSPMKYYEYLAAGLPIVARDTPELRRRGVPFVHFYDERAALPVLVARVLEAPVDRERISWLARDYSWSCLSERLLAFVAGCGRARA